MQHRTCPRLRPALIFLAGLPVPGMAASFQPLPASDGAFFDYALGASASGAVVGYGAGYESTSPLLWTRGATGYAPPSSLPLMAGGAGGAATAIAPDASWISGYVSLPVAGGAAINQAPVVWTRDGSGAYAPSALPRLGPSPAEAVVAGGSANGSRLAGNDGATDTAVVWRTAPGGGYSTQALALPASAVAGPSYATAVSAGGARIAGRYSAASGAQAVAWTETGGTYVPLVLQTLPGGAESFAEAISADGTTAAGASDSATGLRPVKWNVATGAVAALQTFAGSSATVLSLSEDNLWLGGRATNDASLADTAVLWDSAGDIHSLVEVASAAGLSLGNLTPASVTGIHLATTNLYTILGIGVTADTGDMRGFALENIALGGGASAIPEPASFAKLAGAGALAGAGLHRRRRERAKNNL